MGEGRTGLKDIFAVGELGVWPGGLGADWVID